MIACSLDARDSNADSTRRQGGRQPGLLALQRLAPAARAGGCLRRRSHTLGLPRGVPAPARAAALRCLQPCCCVNERVTSASMRTKWSVRTEVCPSSPRQIRQQAAGHISCSRASTKWHACAWPKPAGAISKNSSACSWGTIDSTPGAAAGRAPCPGGRRACRSALSPGAGQRRLAPPQGVQVAQEP